MLRYERNHIAGCKSGDSCKKCPFWIEGRHEGKRFHQSLKTTDSKTAAQLVQRVILTGKLDLQPTEQTGVTVADAITSYREFKQKRSDDTKRKNKLLTDRLQAFLEKRGILKIADVKLPGRPPERLSKR